MTQAASPAHDGPANWKGSDMRERDEWRFHLTETYIGEIKRPQPPWPKGALR